MESWKPCILLVSVMFAYSGIGTFLMAYANERGIENPGLFFTASAVSLALTRLTMGKIHNKFGPIAVLAPGFALFSASLLGVYFSSNITTLVIAGVCQGFGMGALVPEINTLVVLAASKENRGLANSTMFLAMDVGMAIGALLLGVFAEIGGLGIEFLISAILVLITLFVYLILRKTDFWCENF